MPQIQICWHTEGKQFYRVVECNYKPVCNLRVLLREARNFAHTTTIDFPFLRGGWPVGSHTNLLHFIWSCASTLLSPQSLSLISFSTTWFHVIFGLPLPLTLSTLYNMLLFIQSQSSFHNTRPNFSHYFNPYSLPLLYMWYLIHQRLTAHPSQHSHLCLLKLSYPLCTNNVPSLTCIHHSSHLSHAPSFLTSVTHPSLSRSLTALNFSHAQCTPSTDAEIHFHSLNIPLITELSNSVWTHTIS